jgi:2,3-bisphosphoglycerate-dependent phosphoglycerate mutase
MELYLIRHAQSANNARPPEEREEDPPLTDVGHQQCSFLAQWIPALNPTRVITSPFMRAQQTADYIGNAVSLRPMVRIEAHEQGGCVSGPSPDVFVGRPGMTRSQIQQQFPGFDISPEIDGQGWWGSKPFENEDEARQRAARLLAQTVKEFAVTREPVAFVTHADFKRLLIGQFHIGALETPRNASVTTIIVSAGGCRLVEYDRVSHLPSDLVTV